MRLLGDLDLAEESMHEAFAAALESWAVVGVPEKPRPWLICTARFKAIDAIRRRARFNVVQRDLIAHMEARACEAPGGDEEIEYDRLRLIFTCCHPALPPEGQEALMYGNSFEIRPVGDMDDVMKASEQRRRVAVALDLGFGLLSTDSVERWCAERRPRPALCCAGEDSKVAAMYHGSRGRGEWDGRALRDDEAVGG